MASKFVKVAALEKGVRIMELLAQSKKPLGSREIAIALGYHVGTVYNILYTYNELGLTEIDPNKKFSLGPKLIELGKAAVKKFDLLPLIHPYLEDINSKTSLTTLLSIRSGLRSIVIDKVESDYSLQFSPGYGREIPLLGGSIGKALLSLLPDDEFDDILANNKLKKYTAKTCVDKKEIQRDGPKGPQGQNRNKR